MTFVTPEKHRKNYVNDKIQKMFHKNDDFLAVTFLC